MSQAPLPAQPLPAPIPTGHRHPQTFGFEPNDWVFLDAKLRWMQSTRDATASDVSLEVHRVWRLFTPDCNPSITFVLARAATEGVSSEFIGAAHTRLLEPRYFHSNAGRGYVWNPTVSTRSPDTPNHPPHDGRAIAGDTAPSHLDSAPPRRQRPAPHERAA